MILVITSASIKQINWFINYYGVAIIILNSKAYKIQEQRSESNKHSLMCKHAYFSVHLDEISVPNPELFDLSGSAIQIGGITMAGNVFKNLSIGIWLRKDGSCAIGVG